jgi:hypothetical protein
MRQDVVSLKNSWDNLSLDDGWMFKLQILGCFGQGLLDE